MQLEKKSLLEFLKEVDSHLRKRIDLVAAGGTAMTLLDIKQSTIDIDFIVAGSDFLDLKRALNSVPHGYRIDIFRDGFVFSQKLPEDYIQKSILIRKFKSIRLYALHPLDIIVTKIGRLNERDTEDIKDCIRKFNIRKAEIKKRAKMVEYVGQRQNYETNLSHVLKSLF